MHIQFYHLLSTPLEVALPKLAATAYERDIRVCIAAEPAMIPVLDKALWTYHPNSFLPHGTEDANEAEHPILIAEAPSTVNHATLLIITNGITVDVKDTAYERVFDMFNGHDEGAVQAARERWKAYQAAEVPLTYIKQRDNGGWDTLKESA